MANLKLMDCLVVDSGAFIRNAQLQNIGKKIYCIHEVVNEIRDKATRQRLQVLPYGIIFKEPSPESIKTVSDFTVKTGDYKSLSLTDMKVMALTYQLHKEKLGADNLRTEPTRQKTWTANDRILEKPTEIAGFFFPKDDSSKEPTGEIEATEATNIIEHMDDLSVDDVELSKDSDDNELFEEKIHTDDRVHIDIVDVNEIDMKNVTPVSSGAILPSNLIQEEACSSEDEDSGISDDDDIGWIGPSNIKAVKKQMGMNDDDISDIKVGCITTDFSMQNVLIQMGLNVVSVDGFLIKQAKSYVFRCSACSKITTNMTKAFCSFCGNKTLQKLSMTVNENGSIQYHMSKKFVNNLRGLQYSLPMPKGGKHACNPKLCEDQREPQNKGSKLSRVKYDVFDPHYIAHDSPFAPIDTHSRAARLGIRQNHSSNRKKNPNENRGRKK